MYSDLHRILDSIEQQVAELRARIEQLEADSVSTPPPPAAPSVPAVHARASLQAKIELFETRFQGRRDVYAYKWQHGDRKGWSPSTKYRGSTEYRPLTESVFDQHLRGDLFIGIYPMLTDDTTFLLACDFDDAHWRDNARAYAAAARALGVDSLVEISSSGEGAHVWIFFQQPVAARLARGLGFRILRDAMAQQPNMDFSSYDRFFPAQDSLPIRSKGRGRLGNLIALPLQGKHRKQGTTVFVNPETWQPYPDQFSQLASVQPVDFHSLEFEAPVIGPAADLGRGGDIGLGGQLGPGADLGPRPKRRTLRTDASVRLTVDSHLRVPLEDLPAPIIAALKHLACLPNPEFYRRQAQRYSTFSIPRFVVRFHQEVDTLTLPRGLVDEATQLLESAGATVTVKRTRARKRIEMGFFGTLRPEQNRALKDLLKHRTGVVVAPPGFGKTILGCATIAERGLRTAVLVNRKELIEQWRASMAEFLQVEPGQLGGGKRTLSGEIDIIMMQSLAHRDADTSPLDAYDQIIVDECHAVASPATEAALVDARAPYWLGLTATPFRADQMDELITMHLGPIRHTAQPETTAARRVIVRTTEFTTEEPADDGASMNAIYRELGSDRTRNELIVKDICDAADSGRTCIALSNRIEHLESLQELIPARTQVPVHLLHGQLPPQQRKHTLEILRASTEPFILLAIDKVAGEGFDLPQLDTLFLTVPVSFKGRIIQQTGRVTRSDTPALVYDYVDENVPWLKHMAGRRQRTMSSEGFEHAQEMLDL